MDMESARRFIYRHARPLDFARWRVHFEGGSRADVLAALAAYQNADGGFGHGLEADCLNPNSTPVQTWAATQILYEVGVTDAAHPMVAGILRYLDSTPLFDGHTWAGLTGVRSNDDYPHAPWWSYAPEDAPTYNPTASLAGFILRFAPKDSTIYQTGWRVACEAVTWLTRNAPIESMHTAACFVSLYESLRACGSADGIDMEAFRAVLEGQIAHVLTQDTSVWATEYVCKPSLFIDSRDSAFYPANRALCDAECAFIDRTQHEDGTWAIRGTGAHIRRTGPSAGTGGRRTSSSKTCGSAARCGDKPTYYRRNSEGLATSELLFVYITF